MKSSELAIERIRKVMSETFQLNGESVTLETKNTDIALWDSLGHLNLMMAIEEEFEIRMDIEEIADISSVGDIVIVINKKVKTNHQI